MAAEVTAVRRNEVELLTDTSFANTNMFLHPLRATMLGSEPITHTFVTGLKQLGAQISISTSSPAGHSWLPVLISTGRDVVQNPV